MKEQPGTSSSPPDQSLEDLNQPQESVSCQTSQETVDDLGKAVSVDGDVSEGEEDKEDISDLGLPMDDLQKKIGQ